MRTLWFFPNNFYILTLKMLESLPITVIDMWGVGLFFKRMEIEEEDGFSLIAKRNDQNIWVLVFLFGHAG